MLKAIVSLLILYCVCSLVYASPIKLACDIKDQQQQAYVDVIILDQEQMTVDGHKSGEWFSGALGRTNWKISDGELRKTIVLSGDNERLINEPGATTNTLSINRANGNYVYTYHRNKDKFFAEETNIYFTGTCNILKKVF
jgi:hypothetical protein